MRIPVTIDHKLRLKVEELPDPNIGFMLMDALSIDNQERLKAQQNSVFGWERLPEKIELYEVDEAGTLIMPRGFAGPLVDGMVMMGHDVEWNDRRTMKNKLRIGSGHANPRPWQERAIDALLYYQQGIYKAPAGSGKTVAVLLAIRKVGCQSLVIVNTKDILWQWQERVQQHLGENYPCGQVGDSIFEVSPYITIATAQTLHSRFDELEEMGFFDWFSFVCLDEMHHATANTYNRLIDRFSSYYRIGVSATPDRTGDFALAKNVIGPIVHTTYPKEVTNLMRPEVIRVPTRFFYGFKGGTGRFEKSNYGKMISALVDDYERNELIVRFIMENQGHHQLVVSKRLQHLELLATMLQDAGFADEIVTITGPDDNEHRQEAKKVAEARPCVLFSTIADEALDIPRLDRVHLVYPQRNPGLVTQQIGRVEREHPEKENAVIFDYYDGNVGPLDSQWRSRRFEVYEPRGYRITTLKRMPTIT